MIGVAIALAGATAFSAMNVFIRWGVRPGERDNGLRATLIVNVVAFSVLLAVLTLAGRGIWLRPEGVVAFVMAGLLATFFGRYTLFASIRHLGAARATAIKNATPLVSVALAVGFLGERLSLLAAVGMVLVMLGLLLLLRETRARHMGATAVEEGEAAVASDEGVVEGGSGRYAAGMLIRPTRREALLGVVLAVGAAFCFGTGHVARKIGMDVLPDPVLGATIGSWVALLISLGVSTAQRQVGGFVAAVGSFRGAFWLAGAAGAVGQLCFFSALAFAPLSHVAVVAASETVITVLLAALLIQRTEQVTRYVLLPAALVFGGSAIIAIAP